jgi:hypothetical protein
MTKARARDPALLAVVLTASLIALLILLFAAGLAKTRERPVTERQERFVPPGWVSPTAPPPTNP